jgi:hypothetical protein
MGEMGSGVGGGEGNAIVALLQLDGWMYECK